MRDNEALKTYSLDSNPNLETLSFTDEDDWLQLRHKGIGGSDVGAIMGLNKYTSPMQIYKAKVLGMDKDVSDKPAVRKGKDLEPVIRENYFKVMLKDKGFTIIQPQHMLINKKYPWLRANLDGIIIPLDESKRIHTNCIVGEIKVVTQYAEDNWYGPDYCGVPASYYAQVQEYMLVTETKMAILGALFENSWEMHYFQIPADEEFQKKLLAMSKKFYDENMTMKIPPALDSELDKDDIIKAISESKAEEIPSQEITDSARQYKNTCQAIKVLESQKKMYLTDITNRYLAGERSNDPDIKIKFSTYTRSTLDTKRLEEDHPDLVKEYKKVTEYSKSTIE